MPGGTFNPFEFIVLVDLQQSSIQGAPLAFQDTSVNQSKHVSEITSCYRLGE